MSTPAGVFEINGTGFYHKAPSFTRAIPEKTLIRKDGTVVPFEVPSSIHLRNVPKNKIDCNKTNGCTGLSKEDLIDLAKYINKGTPYYILPENNLNKFELRGSGINFLSNDITKLPSYNSSKIRDLNLDLRIKPEKQIQQASIVGILPDFISSKLRKLKVNLTGLDPNSPLVYKNQYESKKQELIKDLDVNTDTYDDLAKLSLALSKQESS